MVELVEKTPAFCGIGKQRAISRSLRPLNDQGYKSVFSHAFRT